MSAMWSRIRESRAGIAATVAVIAAVLLVPFGYTVHVRNETIRLENRVEAGASQVDTVIQKRLDSLNQLVRTAQESAQFESDAINRIIEARDKTASGDVEGAKYEWLDPSQDVAFPEGTRFHGMNVSGGYVYETSTIRYTFKAARGGYDGSVTLHAGEGGKLSKVADFQRGKSVEEYRESYTSTARAYIMPVIMEALVLIVVFVVTYALVMRAAERS